MRWKLKNKIISLFVRSMLWRYKRRNVFCFYQLSVFFKEFLKMEGDHNGRLSLCWCHWPCVSMALSLSLTLATITSNHGIQAVQTMESRANEKHSTLLPLKYIKNTTMFRFLTISGTDCCKKAINYCRNGSTCLKLNRKRLVTSDFFISLSIISGYFALCFRAK